MNIVDDSSVQWPHCTNQFNSEHLFNYTGIQYSFGDCGNTYSFVYIAIFKLLCQYMLLYLCLGYSSFFSFAAFSLKLECLRHDQACDLDFQISCLFKLELYAQCDH
jgi:hypothetical protein